MSTEHDGSTELTPFEFALAGVAPPNGAKTSSLQAIEDMRALLDGVEHAPVSHVGLREFLDHGGPIDSRRRHRLGRSGATTIAGHFVDITPTELSPADGNGADHESDAPAAVDASITGQSTAERPAGEVLAIETDPEDEQPDAASPPSGVAAIGLSAALGGAADEEALSEEIAGVHAELTRLLGDADHHHSDDTDDTDGTDDEPVLSADGGDGIGPRAGAWGHAIDETPEVDPAPVSALAVDPGDDEAPFAPLSPPVDESPMPPVQPVPAAELGSVTDRLRDGSGRFAIPGPGSLDGADGPADGNRAGDGTSEPPVDRPGGQIGEVAGTAAAAAVLFADTASTPAGETAGLGAAEAELFAAPGEALGGQTDEEARGDVTVAAAPAGAGLLEAGDAGPPMVGPPPAQTGLAAMGRPGGPVLAAVGAAAAAAALIAGALWWTSTASERTTSAGEAAAPTTAEATETAATEAGGSESTGATSGATGDGTSRADRFGSSGSTSTSAPGTTAEGTTATTRPSSTAETSVTVGVETTAREGTTTSTVATSSTDEPSSTSEATVSTTAPTSTTAAPTTVAPTTVTVPTTPAPTTAPPLAYIGDRVTIGDYDGDGLAGVRVSLWADDDRDRTADRRIATTTTGANGGYFFDAEAGCYVVRFDPPDGYTIRPIFAEQDVCVGAGEAAARIDALADAEIVAAGPSGCEVEPDTGSRFDGVEIHENDRNWASSYVFYGQRGNVVARTADLGRHDHADNANEREWFGSGNGFDHRSVYSASAIRDGVESAAVACARPN